MKNLGILLNLFLCSVLTEYTLGMNKQSHSKIKLVCLSSYHDLCHVNNTVFSVSINIFQPYLYLLEKYYVITRISSVFQ